MADDVRKALQQLINDIESMYRGAETAAENGDGEEFFGPFGASRNSNKYGDPELEVSWPNLAISLRAAKAALKEGN